MKIFKNISLFLLFLFVGVQLYGQQDPNPVFYRHYLQTVNPAIAGSESQATAVIGLRSQWQGIEEAPQTQILTGNLPLNSKMGLGISVVNDQTFVEKQTGVYIDFSYRLTVSRFENLYLGIKAGGNFFDVNAQGLKTYNYTSDPLLQNTSRFNPNIGVGALLKGENYYISLSAPGLLNTKRFEEKDAVVTEASDRMHLYLSGGYDFNLSADWIFKPSIMLRHVSGIPVSADITAGFLFRERFEFGGVYRTDSALAGFALINVVDWLDIGYAYDSSLRSSINQFGGGTHEVLLKFQLPER